MAMREELVAWLQGVMPEQACSAMRTVPLAIQPPELTTMQTLMRMRCRACRGRVVVAALDNNVPRWRARMVKVWGLGSYG